jgi:hypothetical protein
MVLLAEKHDLFPNPSADRSKAFNGSSFKNVRPCDSGIIITANKLKLLQLLLSDFAVPVQSLTSLSWYDIE